MANQIPLRMSPPVMLERTPFQVDEYGVADEYGDDGGPDVEQEHGPVAARRAQQGKKPRDPELRPEAGISHQTFYACRQIDHAVGVEKKHGDDGGHEMRLPSQMTVTASAVVMRAASRGSVALPI